MSAYSGTGALLRLAWRRDRLLVPLGAAAIAGIAVSSAKATLALYPTAESLGGAIGEIFASPAAVALYGPVGNPASVDSIAVAKMTMMGAVFLSLFGYAVVRRHTRSEEEAGRLELLGSTVVGRRAALSAAVILATLAVLVTCLLTALGYIGLGMPAAGSLAFAAGWAGSALAFVGITAVAAQLAATSRSCAGLAGGAIGAAFLLRSIGDSRPGLGWLSWISPLGWSTQSASFGANRSWVILLGVGVLAAGVLGALALLDRRDLGAGLLAGRRGRATAPASLSSPVGLAWRLGRPGFLGWLAGFAIGGLVVGGLAKSATDLIKDPGIADLLRKMGGGAGLLEDVYLTTEIGFISVIAAAFGIVVALRLRSEEVAGHAEQVLAGATTRARVLAAHTLVGLIGSAVLMLALGGVIGVVDAAAGGSAGVGRLLGAAAAHVPAVWVCIALAVCAYAWLPRIAAGVAWGALALFLTVGEFGGLLGLPGWLINLAPFTHSPRMPVEPFAAAPVVGLLAVATALLALAYAGFRRRDIG